MSSHANNGSCPKCKELLDKYPGFDMSLRMWFEDLQKAVPEAHISSAGRGRDEQELAFQKGASKAHFGKSAHNWNAAIDIFEVRAGKAVWDKAWFAKNIAPRLNSSLVWYGAPGSKFFELPHIELKGWKSMAQEGALGIVEHFEPEQPEKTSVLASVAVADKASLIDIACTVLSGLFKRS